MESRLFLSSVPAAASNVSFFNTPPLWDHRAGPLAEAGNDHPFLGSRDLRTCSGNARSRGWCDIFRTPYKYYTDYSNPYSVHCSVLRTSVSLLHHANTRKRLSGSKITTHMCPLHLRSSVERSPSKGGWCVDVSSYTEYATLYPQKS